MNLFSSTSERDRREPRHKYNTLVHYRIKEKEAIWNYAHSIDISNRGIKLVINCRIENSDVLVLKINIPGQDQPVELHGSAVWKKNLDSRSGVQCGIVFDESTCQEDLERFRIFLHSKFGLNLLLNT